MSTHHDSATAASTDIKKIAGIALAGTSIEWYDFFLYGTAAAVIFPTLFFSHDLPPLVALLASFATFAVGFIARPLGGVLFGHFGDRHGRKRALVVALMIMGGATTAIGCLPTHAVGGAVSTVLLVLLRFLQGLAIGGQWGGAMLLVTEAAPPHRRGFYGSFAQAGAPVGVLLANLLFLSVSALLSQEAFLAWGWRIPFLLSALLIFLALHIHLRLQETPTFRELAAHAPTVPRSPVLQALRAYPREIGLAAGAFLAIQVAFYILITFVIAYGTNSAAVPLSRNMMLVAVLIGAAAMIPAVFLSAMYSDRHGRRGIYMTGAALLAVWSFAIFPLIDTGSLLWASVAIGVGQFLVGLMYGPQAALLAETFSTEVRYSGASLGYQLGAIIGGALAPLIATGLLAIYGSSWTLSVYMATACIVTVVCVLNLKETYRVGLSEERADGAEEVRAPAAPDAT